jgi:hypothetical protein
MDETSASALAMFFRISCLSTVNERNSAAGFTVSANAVLAYLKGRPGGRIGAFPIVVTVNWRSLQP